MNLNKIAIVYDWSYLEFGGAERILKHLSVIWPKAVFYTSIFNLPKTNWAKFKKIKTSFIQKLPGYKSYFRLLAPVLPIAFEQFNFDQFDLVISVTSGPAKAIITKPKTCHICYCLTPPRYYWQQRFTKNKLLHQILTPLRHQDYFISRRPDYYLTISKNTVKRINKFYKVKPEIVYPGVNLNKFKPKEKSIKKEDYFLLVSRLVSYKKVDLVIKSFNQLGLKLLIVGEGREKDYLKSIANDNVSFLSQVSDQKLVKLYQNCQALIFPQEEDFGLTPIEAQACGKPIIAYEKGGARETIINGVTGLFFQKQTQESLIKAVKEFNPRKYNKDKCRQNAENYSLEKFMLLFRDKIEVKFKQYQNNLI